MPNHNKVRFIGEAVRSVLGQTFEDFELVIVDDCSTDGSMKAVSRAAKGDVRVRTLALPRNSGAGAARNAGIRAALGSVIALIDSDDLYSPVKLERQFDRLGEIGENSVVYTDWWRVDGEGAELPPFHRGHVTKSGRIFGDLLVRSLGINTTLMAPRALLEEVGPYDEFLRYSEDQDMILRLARRFKFEYVNEKLYGYRVHEGNSWSLMPVGKRSYYKALVAERHLREAGEVLSGAQRRAVERQLLQWYWLSSQHAKMVKMGLSSFERLVDLGKILASV